MDVIRPDQFLTLGLFMAVLALGWLLVQLNRGGLSRRIAQGRRLRLVEALALSPTDRALILSVDGRDYLLLRSKGAAPLLQPLPAPLAPQMEGVE